MSTDGECYFCHGIVFPYEADDIHLERHDGHEVYMHGRCAEGHGVVEETSEGTQVYCPECGAVEAG